VGGGLIFVLIVKILLSGFLFKSGWASSPGPNFALAQDQTQVRPPDARTGSPEKLTLESLKERELALRARELELKKKEEELIPLKKDVEEKLGELNEVQSRLTAYAKTLADREEAIKDSKMTHLVDLYTAMEPIRAAAIMEKLKMETVVLLLRHMKGKPAGQIIGLMKPEFGAQVVEKLSRMD
jgi:flagellar motility protein MotE (MotC chaperone)